MKKKDIPNPGSGEAVAKGCTCPVLDNAHGKGTLWGDDTFWINGDCPLHGTRSNFTKVTEDVE
jgi:hypothetical protein